MTDIDMDDLREKAAKATPGPWEAVEEPLAVRGPREPWDKGRGLARLALMQMPWRAERMRANAEYIAAANPTVVLALIKRVEKAERERDEWKNSDGEMCKYAGSLKSRALTAERERDALVEKIERVLRSIDRPEADETYAAEINDGAMLAAVQAERQIARDLRRALDGTEGGDRDE